MSDFNILCCCEYHNLAGERSHLLACCCDCQALDDACDRCLTCREIPNSTIQRFVTTLLDRCRVPWCSGTGAVQMRLDIIVPVVMVPLCLLIATVSLFFTIAIFVLMPVVMFSFYRIWKMAGHQPTSFFYLWGLTSVIFSLFVFCAFVVLSFRKILLWETLLLLSSSGLMLYYVQKAQQNPGRLKPQVRLSRESKSKFIPNGNSVFENKDVKVTINEGMIDNEGSPSVVNTKGISAQQVTWVDSRPIKDGLLQLYCNACSLNRPARSGHCSVCNCCVAVRDHHCVWINTCIGANNHRSFLAAMFLFLFCGYYGSHLTLTTICSPVMYLDWFLVPGDCRFLYGDFQTSVCFVNVCYTLLVTSIMSVGFIHQLILISQNVTSQEMHQASTRGWSRMGLFAANNVNNHGFIRNWFEFFLSHGRRASPTIPS